MLPRYNTLLKYGQNVLAYRPIPITNLNPPLLLLNSASLQLQCFNPAPSRATHILRRTYGVDLYKRGNKPNLTEKTFFYELVENTDRKPDAMIDVVLTSRVPGIGNKGDVISMKRTSAYYKLLLPGYADYATPELLEYSNNLKKDTALKEKEVSLSEEVCIGYLQKKCLLVIMNKETKWTLEPWHIRASFRISGIHVSSDDCIEIPTQPITGPDLGLEGKEFFITAILNKKHKIKVRCRLHHWSTAIADRLPYPKEYWLDDAEKIFPEGNEDTVVTPSNATK